MTRTLLHKPTLTGKLVELRPFDEEAINAMLEILTEPDVLKRTGTVDSTDQAQRGNPLSEEKTRAWYATRHGQTDRIDLAIYSFALQRYIGEVVLNDYDADKRSLNFRIAIGKRGQGSGHGTEATKLIVDYAFDYLDIDRIELEVFELNERARHVYTSVGFVETGRIKNSFTFDGTSYDAITKAVTRDNRHVPHQLTLAAA